MDTIEANIADDGLMRLLSVGGLLVALVYFAWRKGQAGAVLFDLGRSGVCTPILVCGLVLVPMSIVALIGDLLCSDAGFAEVCSQSSIWLFNIILGSSVILMMWSGRQIRANGLWSFRIGFLRWERIEAWMWAGEGDHILHIVGKGRIRFFLWATERWRIPPHHKDAVEQLLSEHVSVATGETDEAEEQP